MPVNMNDVAKQAGVSRSTVSLVLNGKAQTKYKFSPETVERVRQVAVSMGYVPNRNASSLITKKSHMIGVLQGRFDSKRSYIMNAMISRVLSPDYNCVFAVHDYDGKAERKHLRMFMESRLGGLVAEWSHDQSTVEFYHELTDRYQTPIIFVGDPVPGLEAPVLTSDHYGIAYSATQALIELGHRHIVFASSGGHLSNDLLNRQGFQKAMADGGLAKDGVILSPRQRDLHSLRVNRHDDLKQYAVEITGYCQSHPAVTAIVSQGDPLAYEILDSCATVGIGVPDDLSVIGFGDHAPSSLSIVNLSTVCSDSYETIGQKAAEMLLNMIEGHKVTSQVRTFPVKVILRGSTRGLGS